MINVSPSKHFSCLNLALSILKNRYPQALGSSCIDNTMIPPVCAMAFYLQDTRKTGFRKNDLETKASLIEMFLIPNHRLISDFNDFVNH